MDRENLPSFSISLGTWLRTHVRVSLWFPLILIVFWSRLGLVLGTTCVVLLFASVIVHEFFHVYGARLTGGDGHEILIWPLGGLAYCQPGPSLRSELVTTAAGPLANVLIALATLPVAMSAGAVQESLHPVMLPHLELNETLLQDWGVLLFAINVKLIYLNLLPVLPLDGGRFLQSLLLQSWEPKVVRKAGLIAGLVVAFVLAIIGHNIDPESGIALISIAAILFCLNYTSFVEQRVRDMFGQVESSELGYDFSEGYSSLNDDEEQPRQPGMLEKWKANREGKKREREATVRAEEESRLDDLLDKVHQQGMNSLTPSEQRFLKEVSARRAREK